MNTIKRTKMEYLRLVLRILLPIACASVLAFIFSNSLKTGEVSSAQSSAVVDAVQAVFGVIAPNSAIATATGEDYERLHACIRLLAHFAEFALLGACLAAISLHTAHKKGRLNLVKGVPFVCASIAGGIVFAVIDEIIQLTSEGRACEFSDVVLDTIGVVLGVAFACLVAFVAHKIHKSRGIKITE
jgi:VanZ family protein